MGNESGSKGPGGGMMGGSGSGGSSRTASSSASSGGRDGGTRDSVGSQNRQSSSSRTSTAGRAPGASAAAAKASAAKASAAKASTTSRDNGTRGPVGGNRPSSNLGSQNRPTGGSGVIGSKGGGASTQRPGAGKGPASAGQSNTLKAFTAGSNLAANRAQEMKGVGQGFIKSKTQSLKDQYSQYRSPQGITAPKAPTAGRGTTVPTKAPGVPTAGRGITDPRRATVTAGTGWTNPNGVPDNVAKALAEKGFAPDGTRLPTQSLVNRGPLDPSMPGRLAEANKNYKTVTGPGGMVSRVYADPDLAPKPVAPSPKVAKVDNASYFADMRQPMYKPLGYQIGSVFDDEVVGPIKRGFSGLVDTFTGAPAAPAMKYAAPIGPQKPAATPGQLAALNTPSYPVDPSIPGRLQAINAPQLNPRVLTENFRPGFTPGKPANVPTVPQGGATLSDALGWVGDQGAQIMRGWGRITDNALSGLGAGINALADIGVSPGAPISGPDGITRAPGGIPSTDGLLGRPSVNPMATQGPSFADANAAQRANTSAIASLAAPTAPAMPGATGEEGIQPSVPVRAPGIAPPRPQARPGDFKDAYDTGEPITYQGQGQGDAPTAADIAGVGNEEAISPAGVQNSYKVQRGDTLSKIAAKNGTTVKAIAEANGIKNVNSIREGMTISVPTNASVQPMGATVDQLDRVADMMREDYDYAAPQDPALADGLMFGGYASSIPDNSPWSTPNEVRMPRQGSSEADDGSASPSQEYDGPPDENPSQYDGQAQSLRELDNRYEYEKQRAKDGVRALPSRLAQAIREGDFRSPLGRGNFSSEVGSRDQQNGTIPSSGYAPSLQAPDLNALVAQLLAALEQQQGGILSGSDQMDLVNRTFI